jgi:hypothetical protein
MWLLLLVTINSITFILTLPLSRPMFPKQGSVENTFRVSTEVVALINTELKI